MLDSSRRQAARETLPLRFCAAWHGAGPHANLVSNAHVPTGIQDLECHRTCTLRLSTRQAHDRAAPYDYGLDLMRTME